MVDRGTLAENFNSYLAILAVAQRGASFVGRAYSNLVLDRLAIASTFVGWHG